VQYEPVCVKFDETCSMLSNPGVTVEQKFLHSATEDALKIDRPLVISNLDHRKLDLLKAEEITAERLCLQALCMKKYPSGPIIDVPMVVKVTIEDTAFCRSNKKSPRTLVPSKSISDSDMPEFVSFWETFRWHYSLKCEIFFFLTESVRFLIKSCCYVGQTSYIMLSRDGQIGGGIT